MSGRVSTLMRKAYDELAHNKIKKQYRASTFKEKTAMIAEMRMIIALTDK